MSTPPPPFDPSDDDADERYRRASERDPSRPSEATRRVVLEHAARLAAERARRAGRRSWQQLAGATLRWQAIVGTAAAAALAGVMIAPRFLAPTVPSVSPGAPASAPAAQLSLQKSAPPPAYSSAPAVNAPEPARVPPARAPAPAARPAGTAASDAVTTQQLEQRAEAKAERAPSLSEVVVTGNSAARSATVPIAAASQAAPVARPASPPQGSASPVVLRQAAASGDLVAFEGALARVGDIDARDAQGRTALMLATLKGQAGAVAVLLAHGADPSGADAQGTTPLQAAVAADEREIIALLRRYGAR